MTTRTTSMIEVWLAEKIHRCGKGEEGLLPQGKRPPSLALTSRHSLAAIAGFNQKLAQLSQGASTNETNRTSGQPQSTRYFVIWHGRIFKEEQTHHFGVS